MAEESDSEKTYTRNGWETVTGRIGNPYFHEHVAGLVRGRQGARIVVTVEVPELAGDGPASVDGGP